MKKYILFILLNIPFLTIYAIEGCLFNGRMYHGSYTFEGPIGLFPKRFYNSTSFYSNVATVCPVNSTAFYALYTTKVNNGLGGDINCGVGPYSTTNYNAATGIVYNFNYIQCPLDNSAILLVVCSGCLGLIFIKKYKFCMMM